MIILSRGNVFILILLIVVINKTFVDSGKDDLVIVFVTLLGILQLRMMGLLLFLRVLIFWRLIIR